MKLLILSFFFTTMLFANNLQKINSFEATFKQSIINHSGKKIVYTGKIYMKKPLQLVWKYNDPIEKFVYIKKNKVTIIEPDLEQAIISKLDKGFNILELFKNSKRISPSQYISIFNDIKYKLTIIDNKLQQIAYKDNLDNSIFISFSHIHQNKPIMDKIFEFQIPQEYDIMRK